MAYPTDNPMDGRGMHKPVRREFICDACDWIGTLFDDEACECPRCGSPDLIPGVEEDR